MKKQIFNFKPIFLCIQVIVIEIIVMLFIQPMKASAISEITIVGNQIYANGNALILEAGSTSEKTLIYLDSNSNGIIDNGETSYDLGLSGGDTTSGYNLSNYFIFGGGNTNEVPSTKITMLGGAVYQIFGGGNSESAIVKGDANILITGSARVNTVVYGGGNESYVKRQHKCFNNRICTYWILC